MKRHLPIDYEIVDSSIEGTIMELAQDGFVIIYSTKRQTPIFVAERMDGYIFDRWKKNKQERLRSQV